MYYSPFNPFVTPMIADYSPKPLLPMLLYILSMAKKISRSKKSLFRKRYFPRSRKFYCLAILLLAALAAATLLSLRHYEDNAEKQRIAYLERERFHTIEYLVNTIKVDLEKSLPDKQWEIVQYCEAAHAKTTEVFGIRCYNMIFGTPKPTLDEMRSVATRYLNIDGEGYISLYPREDEKYVFYITTIDDTGCNSYPSEAYGYNLYCSSNASSFIYPERE